MKIKIKSGVYGYKLNNKVIAKNKDSEPFEVENKEAKRLIEMGVAIEIVEAVEKEIPIEETEVPEEGIEEKEEIDLESMTKAELIAYAEEMEIAVNAKAKKADIIAAIKEELEDDGPSLGVDDIE